MNLYWNAFSPLNLAIDAGILLTFPLFLRWFLNRKGFPLVPAKFEGGWVWRATIGLVLYAVLFRIVSSFALFLSGFMMIHLFWTLGTIVLPIGLVALALKSKRPGWLLFAASILVLKVYAEVLEPNQLEITVRDIDAPALREELRVAHISDLQTDNIRGLHREAARAIEAFDPHMVVFTSDVLNHTSIIPIVQEYLKQIAVPDRSYFVTGNVDHILNLAEFERESGFRVMDGRVVSLNLPQGQVSLLGLGLRDFGNFELLSQMKKDTRNADYRILLSHYPDAMFMASKRGINVLFAGHTHGGQVVIPGFGPPMTLSKVPRSFGAGGVHDFQGLKVVVSRGLGMEGHIAPRIRIFCPPQLMLIRLGPGAESKR